jgi:SsrA-binding protein
MPKRQELFLLSCHIGPYDPAANFAHAPTRARKLLLHRREIDRLENRVAAKGLTLIPLKMYFKHNHVKVELGLARGKKQYDKREALHERDAQREIASAHKQRQRG